MLEGLCAEMLLVLKFFALAYSALLPVINPLGSALLFLAVAGSVPPEQFRYLARRVAVSMVLFLLVFEGGGAALLNFFGISLPVVQFAGGFVLAAMGSRILDQKESTNERRPSPGTLDEKVFFPLTFPISAGPACVVVTLTLSAHASRNELVSNVLAHLGMASAIVALGVTLWLCYAYAPKVAQKMAPATVQGVLRVVAFVLLCIGVQIASNGLEAIVKTARK
jgi:multiple antibiotic resistance protein